MPNYDRSIDLGKVTNEKSFREQINISSTRAEMAKLWSTEDTGNLITTLADASTREGFPLLLALESSIDVLNLELSMLRGEPFEETDVTVDQDNQELIAKNWGEDCANQLISTLTESSRRVEFNLPFAIEVAIDLLRKKHAELSTLPTVTNPEDNQPTK